MNAEIKIIYYYEGGKVIWSYRQKTEVLMGINSLRAEGLCQKGPILKCYENFIIIL